MRTGSPARPRRPSFVHQAVRVDREPPIEHLAAISRTPLDRLLRADALVRLALAAVAGLEATSGPLAGAGVVVGTALATLETNALFAARIRERGARAAEARRFPYTSPNAVAGQCSIAFELTGPSFSVGGGMHAALEALACAAVLVESGDADRIVVVAVDDIGPTSLAMGHGSLKAGAVAVLVSAKPTAGARARIGAIELRRGGGGIRRAGRRSSRAAALARAAAALGARGVVATRRFRPHRPALALTLRHRRAAAGKCR